MDLLKRFFGNSQKKIDSKTIESEFKNLEISTEEFSKLSADNRIRKIIAYAETGDLKYYELFKYAILSDNDINVKFAALKHLNQFASHPDCATMIMGLEDVTNVKHLEPYYSMALSKMKLITIEELKSRIDPR